MARCPLCTVDMEITEDGRWEHPEIQPWNDDGLVACPHQDDWLSAMDIHRLHSGLGLEIDENQPPP